LSQALISAAACHENHLVHHKNVEVSTTGIIYLGSPHQGSDGADMMKTMLGLMSLVAPTETETVKDISVLTDFLLLQQQQYRPISSNYLTYYGYETKATRLPGGSSSIIVSTASAVPPSATEAQRVEMPADHIGIAKFGGVGEEAFQRLMSPIRAIAEDSKGRYKERWKKFKCEFLPCCECYHSLKPTELYLPIHRR
jgi:hypothetical protein